MSVLGRLTAAARTFLRHGSWSVDPQSGALAQRSLPAIGDSWVNSRTGVGTARDKNAWTRFGSRRLMPWEELEALYTRNGLAQRIVNMIPDEAMREGFSISGSDESVDWRSIESQLDDLKVRQQISDAWRWARLYGACLVFPKVVDGEADLKQPLVPERIKRLAGIELIEAPWAQPIPTSRGSKIQPEYYQITDQENRILVVHRSRLFRIDGTRAPRRVMESNAGWTPSVLDVIRDQLAHLGGAEANAASLMHVVSQPVLKMSNFGDRLRNGGADEKARIQSLIENVQEAASILGWVVVDAEDDLSTVDRNMEGLTKLLDQFVAGCVRNTGIPRELLLGETVGGLNTGENAGPFRNFYDSVARERQRHVEAGVSWILELLFHARETQGQARPTEWMIEWDALWQETETEKAAREKTKAETATLNYQIGAVEVAEIRAGLKERGEIPDLEDPGDDPLALPDPGSEFTPEPSGGSVQEEALNGAQIASMVSIVEKVQAGLVPRDSAAALIAAAFPSQAANVQAILGSAGLDPETGEPVPTAREEEPEPVSGPPPGDVRTPREIGEMLGVSAASITNMHKRGEIAGWKIGGRWRFSVSEVQEATRREIQTEPAEGEPDAEDPG